MEIFPVLVTITGTMMSFAYYPQAYKIIKKKSVKNVSLATYLIFFPGIFMWFLYGVSLKDAPMIIANGMGLLGCSFVLAAYFIYRNK